MSSPLRWSIGIIRADQIDAVEPTGDDILKLASKVENLFLAYMRLWSQYATNESDAPDLAEIGSRVRYGGLGIRVPAYERHQRRLLEGLFGPLSTDLRNAIGFDVDDAITTLCNIVSSYNLLVILISSFKDSRQRCNGIFKYTVPTA
jgi:hypothetical protein